MEFYRLGYGSLRPSLSWAQRPARSSSSTAASSSSAAASTSGSSSYIQRVQGFQGPFKAACTSGVLSAIGDALAQYLSRCVEEKKGKNGAPADYDPYRTLRMFGFGFFWYGPYQYYWYNVLEQMMPVRSTWNFLCKVAANQLLLAPCTLSAVFAWNLALMDKADQIPDKLQRDLLPTMMNGWKFWVPAASVNFLFVPVQAQVLYMSCCSVLWTAYLSYATTAGAGLPDLQLKDLHLPELPPLPRIPDLHLRDLKLPEVPDLHLRDIKVPDLGAMAQPALAALAAVPALVASAVKPALAPAPAAVAEPGKKGKGKGKAKGKN